MKLCYSVVLAVLLAATPAVVSAQCVSGTISAELQSGGPHDGLYKYTLDITWNLPQGLSNVTLDCGFGSCPAGACSHIYAFDDPGGTGTGVPAGCVVDFLGEFNCTGNPSIGVNDPILKWDAIDDPNCQPGNTGSATLCFYTDVAPCSDVQSPVFLIKDGQNVCAGTITGDCPCPCPVSVDPSSWAGVKNEFK